MSQAEFFATAIFFLCYGVTALHDHHMFQLNSCKSRVQIRWLARNFMTDYIPRRLLPGILWLCLWPVLIPFLPAFFDSAFGRALQEHRREILTAVFFALQARRNWPKEARKPLVYTPRMTRLFVTHALLIALTAASYYRVWRYLPLYMPFFPELVLFALGPFLMLLSNLLNSPLEYAVNRWYIADAKRILRGMPRLLVIGVTGSYGKTSVKHFLTKLLLSEFNVLMTPENYNTTLGVVKTVRAGLRPTHDIFICEMGARNVGDVKEICGLVRPRHGVITAIGPQHLESFRTIGNIVKTKFELADALPENGILFLNWDNDILRNKGHAGARISYSASFGSGADYSAGDIRASGAGTSFRVRFPDDEERVFETPLIGRHNVQNVMAAVAVADSLGVKRSGMAASVRRLEPVPHRLQLIRRNSIIIIDDAYNSNQNGAEAALETLAMFEGCKILVTPGMIELGEAEDEANFNFGCQAAAVCDYVILVGKRQTVSILSGLESAGFPGEKTFVAGALNSALEVMYGIDSGGAQKVVLLENDLPDNY